MKYHQSCLFQLFVLSQFNFNNLYSNSLLNHGARIILPGWLQYEHLNTPGSRWPLIGTPKCHRTGWGVLWGRRATVMMPGSGECKNTGPLRRLSLLCADGPNGPPRRPRIWKQNIRGSLKSIFTLPICNSFPLVMTTLFQYFSIMTSSNNQRKVKQRSCIC